MNIIIDSREQKPYLFPGYKTITQKLNAGDYSIEDYQHRIAIERKSIADLYGTIGKGRKRFVAELERLQGHEYKAIIIEASLKDIVQYKDKYNNHQGKIARMNKYYTPTILKMSPSSVINSLLAWSIRYKVQIQYCCNRSLANLVCLRILEKYYNEVNIECPKK